MKPTIEQHLKDAYALVDEMRERASAEDRFADLAEYSRLSTVLYDLASYFGEDGITLQQRERLIQMGFKP